MRTSEKEGQGGGLLPARGGGSAEGAADASFMSQIYAYRGYAEKKNKPTVDKSIKHKYHLEKSTSIEARQTNWHPVLVMGSKGAGRADKVREKQHVYESSHFK